MAKSFLPARPDAEETTSGSDTPSPGAVPAAVRDPGFGGALILLGVLGTVLGGAVMVLVDWRVGLATYSAIVVLLVTFLCWEMHRDRVRRSQSQTATTSPADLVGTGTNPL